MKPFIVVRHGSNGANQSMLPRKVLGTVNATDAAGALLRAAERWTCYNGQRFEVIDMTGRTRKADREAASFADAVGSV